MPCSSLQIGSDASQRSSELSRTTPGNYGIHRRRKSDEELSYKNFDLVGARKFDLAPYHFRVSAERTGGWPVAWSGFRRVAWGKRINARGEKTSDRHANCTPCP